MTLQEYFDKTVEHLRTLDGQAREPGTSRCLYLTPDKRKCAVGAHIPDGHPAQRWMGGVEDLVEIYPDLVGVAAPGHPDGLFLAERLQETHDNEGNWDSTAFVGEDELVQIADDYDLTYEAPE